MLIPVDPGAPLTLWSLGAFIVAGVIALSSPFISWRRDRQQQIELGIKDQIRHLSLALEEPIIFKKIEIIVGSVIAAAIKTHDEARYVHRAALDDYPNMGQLNNAMQTLRTEIDGVRTMIKASDASRKDDLIELKGLIKDANAERKSDFDRLDAKLDRITTPSAE